MNNVVVDKSFGFAVRIVNLCKYLNNEKNEYVLSKQLLKCGTSIGANISESQNAQSENDFLAKLYISSKEASETKYWLKLLFATDYISKKEFESIYNDCEELHKIITSIILTVESKKN